MESTLAEISEAYADGKVVAPRSGVVNGLAVNPGTAVRPGDTITDILIGERYVLAYITPGSLARVEPGDPVTVRYGVENTTGTMRAVLPFSARLPAEFQRAFRPSDRARPSHRQDAGDNLLLLFGSHAPRFHSSTG